MSFNTDLFTPAFAQPAGSPIRELFPYLSRPGMISFAGGYPSPALFDAQGLAEAAQAALTSGPECLQYGATEGSPALKEALAALGATRGILRPASGMLVTTGSQQGFDLLVRIFVQPGSTVLIETPAYPAAIQSLRLAGAGIVGVPVDDQGLDTVQLEALLRGMAPAQRPRLLYTVPSFSNPGGTLMSQARRAELVRLALAYGFLVVEDDPYGELNFSNERTEPVFVHGERLAGEDNPVIYLSSLSKTVAPALRIGWMVAAPEVIRRCAVAKQTTDLCTSPVAQAIALEYLRSGRYPSGVARACAQYRERVQAMTGALARELPEALRFVQPRGGMFLWTQIAQPVEARRLFEAAVEQGVLFVPGGAFYPDGGPRDAMRLSFAAPDVAQIQEGVARLGRAWRAATA